MCQDCAHPASEHDNYGRCLDCGGNDYHNLVEPELEPEPAPAPSARSYVDGAPLKVESEPVPIEFGTDAPDSWVMVDIEAGTFSSWGGDHLVPASRADIDRVAFAVQAYYDGQEEEE